MKTTKGNFEVFKKECKIWIEYYGLVGWEVEFEQVPVEGGIAEHLYDTEGRWAYIRLATDWGKVVISHYEITKSSFHEVTELWLGKLRALAKDRYVREVEIEDEVHSLVRTLENRVFDNLIGGKVNGRDEGREVKRL